MAIKLTPKELAMRGLTPTGEKLKPEEEQKWLIPGGIDPRTGAMVAPGVPSISTVPGVSGVTTGGWLIPGSIDPRTGAMVAPSEEQKVDVPEVSKQALQEADVTIPISVESAKPTGITLHLSDSERQKLAAKAGQTTCLADQRKYEPRIYKATLKGGDYVLVEAAGKKSAQDRATEAGYNVQRITWSPSYGEPARTRTVPITGDTIKVKDGKTGETLAFPKEGWEVWPAKYKTIVKQDGYEAAMKVFKKDYYQLADGQWLPKADFYALPTRYADIAATKGYGAMVTAFEDDHVKLGDGQWIAKSDWNTLVVNDKKAGTDFAEIGKDKGYDAMVAAIDKANEPYEEFLKKIERGDIIPVGKGEYITKEEFTKLPTGSQQILKEQGFEALAAITLTWEKGPRPKKPWGMSEERWAKKIAKWEAYPDTMTKEELKSVPFLDLSIYNLSEGSYKRAGLLALSSFFPPAKATLPEYTMKDVTAFDWGIAAAQVPLIAMGFAPGAIASSVAGRAVTIGAASTLSGLIGYGTAKNWANLTPAQRAMGVGMAALCAVPLITTVARNVKISGPTIPTTKGNTVVWKGLSVAGHPIIGKAGGKWVLGTRSITLPEARLILNGYKPEMMLETKVFVNKSALAKAGFSKVQIDYLTTTLKNRNLFAGKTSPWLDKNVLIEPTARLNANEIGIVMKRLIKLEQGFIKVKKIKDAFLLYGSSTIKSQLAPKLRNWRSVHDWDISLNMNQAQTEAFTRALLRDLKAKGGGTYRISQKSTTLIEKKIANTGNPAKDWAHIADIHSQEAAITSAMDLPTSKLDATGAYSYGRMVAEPAITVKYPGVGELRIMRLSESGVRKADTILRVRQGKGGTAFKPPERGIAQPGVPKDAADFYVTLRTFRGEVIAEEWLEAWAKAMGYSKSQMATVLPRIRKAMLEVAAQTPSSIIGYEFKPSGSVRVPVGASPSITVHVPSSLGASVSGKLENQISKPIYPYKLAKSPEKQAAISAGLSAVLSRATSKAIVSPKISPSVARSIKASTSPKPSPSLVVSKVPSLSAKPSPSIVPKISPSGKPSKATRPSKVPSPTPSTIPSPGSIPPTSPKPSPYPSPSPRLGPKPKPLPLMTTTKSSKKIKRSGPALAVWKQGVYWVSIFPPFRTTGKKEDVVYSRTKPPWGSVIARGRHAPRKTLRSIGKVPQLIEVPMGVVTARIINGRKLTFSRSNHRKRGRVVY